MRRRFLFVVVACLFCGAFAKKAQATALVRLTDAQMVEHSSLIVQGKVLYTLSFWNKAGTAIVTQVTLLVKTELLGRKAPKTIVVGHYGGTVGGRTMELEGGPRFLVGEEVILFLHTTPHLKNEFLLTGWTQGKWKVSSPKASFSPDTPQDQRLIVMQPKGALSWEGHAIGNAPLKPMSLHAFRSRIRTLWAAQRQKKRALLQPTKAQRATKRHLPPLPAKKQTKPAASSLQGGGR